jgi:hypothetical protein
LHGQSEPQPKPFDLPVLPKRWSLMTRERIVAFCLVTQPELDRLGANFERAYPIDDAPCFEDLLAAIDAAERSLEQQEGPKRSGA